MFSQNCTNRHQHTKTCTVTWICYRDGSTHHVASHDIFSSQKLLAGWHRYQSCWDSSSTAMTNTSRCLDFKALQTTQRPKRATSWAVQSQRLTRKNEEPVKLFVPGEQCTLPARISQCMGIITLFNHYTHISPPKDFFPVIIQVSPFLFCFLIPSHLAFSPPSHMFLWSFPSEHLAEGSGSASHTGFLNTPFKKIKSNTPRPHAGLFCQLSVHRCC